MLGKFFAVLLVVVGLCLEAAVELAVLAFGVYEAYMAVRDLGSGDVLPGALWGAVALFVLLSTVRDHVSKRG